ncbi:MAG: SAM-dependent methyltransferase [Deltaproteobacteria bacterium]|jgi:23S rRNA (uridine2552-2'-O)-methyltransferase|nr:SAM-dependent methyltransferase [Deltaproteobacteria bacterium]
MADENKDRQDYIIAHDRLVKLDDLYALFQPGQKVLILGCAQGYWRLYAAEEIHEDGLVIGVDNDLSDLEPPASNVQLVKADILSKKKATTLKRLMKTLGPGANAVLSELFPQLTGDRQVDQAQSLELVKAAWSWAKELLIEGGFFLFKLLHSQVAEEFLESLRPCFERSTRLKTEPNEFGQEIYVLFRGFKKKP